MGIGVRRSEKTIAGVLRLSSGISFLLMAAGSGLLLGKGGAEKLQSGFGGLAPLLAAASSLEPAAIMTLGVIVLLFTPMLGVVTAGISFLIIERDIKYALVSMGVLVILSASFFLAGYK